MISGLETKLSEERLEELGMISPEQRRLKTALSKDSRPIFEKTVIQRRGRSVLSHHRGVQEV